jgi:hypothetical protein
MIDPIPKIILLVVFDDVVSMVFLNSVEGCLMKGALWTGLKVPFRRLFDCFRCAVRSDTGDCGDKSLNQSTDSAALEQGTDQAGSCPDSNQGGHGDTGGQCKLGGLVSGVNVGLFDDLRVSSHDVLLYLVDFSILLSSFAFT